jgi:quercetin dioxygenase-like cupin family protein|tara:strand:- start:2255 stop:2596 length:342 start_codon:yes stop_codon:yes gene_type:complete
VCNNLIKINKKDVEQVLTNHGIGIKQIFLSKDSCRSNLMQVAYGSLQKDEKIEEHAHSTMEEFFFFETGETNFFIESEKYVCKRGDFLMIPAGAKHYMEAKSNTAFLYWGISI